MINMFSFHEVYLTLELYRLEDLRAVTVLSYIEIGMKEDLTLLTSALAANKLTEALWTPLMPFNAFSTEREHEEQVIPSTWRVKDSIAFCSWLLRSLLSNPAISIAVSKASCNTINPFSSRFRSATIFWAFLCIPMLGQEQFCVNLCCSAIFTWIRPCIHLPS